MILVDTNVMLDLLGDERWRDWSRAQLESGGADHDLAVDTIVVAEMAPAFPTLEELRRWLEAITVIVLPLDDEVAFAAGTAFRAYRRRHGTRDAMLSDFLIGAHALILGATLLTRDMRIYRRYFPDLALIAPEMDHG